ncbi:hypothetical protein, partial [Paracoccus pacificus]
GRSQSPLQAADLVRSEEFSEKSRCPLVKNGMHSDAQKQIDIAEASGDRRLTIIPSSRAAMKEAGLRVADNPR